jgi:hypothetical protein
VQDGLQPNAVADPLATHVGGVIQEPLLQTEVEPQAFPQTPQLLTSVLKSTQAPLQLVSPDWQEQERPSPEYPEAQVQA